MFPYWFNLKTPILSAIPFWGQWKLFWIICGNVGYKASIKSYRSNTLLCWQKRWNSYSFVCFVCCTYNFSLYFNISVKNKWKSALLFHQNISHSLIIYVATTEINLYKYFLNFKQTIDTFWHEITNMNYCD